MPRICPVCSAELAEEAGICTKCGNEEFENKKVIAEKKELWEKIEARRQRLRELEARREKLSEDDHRNYRDKKEQLQALGEQIESLEGEIKELEERNREIDKELNDFDGLDNFGTAAGKEADGESAGDLKKGREQESGISELELRERINRLQDKLIEEVRKAVKAERTSEIERERNKEETEEVLREKKDTLAEELENSRKNKPRYGNIDHGLDEQELESLEKKVENSSLTEIEENISTIKDKLDDKRSSLKIIKKNNKRTNIFGFGTLTAGGLLGLFYLVISLQLFGGISPSDSPITNLKLLFLRLLASAVLGVLTPVVFNIFSRVSDKKKKSDLSGKIERLKLKYLVHIEKFNENKEEQINREINRLEKEYQEKCQAAEKEHRSKRQEIRKELSDSLEELTPSISGLKSRFHLTALHWQDEAWRKWSTSGYIPAAVRLGDTELNLQGLDISEESEKDAVLSPYRLDLLEGTLEESLVLITEMGIYDIEDILSLLAMIARKERGLFIVASDAGREVIETLAVNRDRGTFTSSIITIQDKKALSEIARETGAQVLNREDVNDLSARDSWSDFAPVLGTAVRVKVSENQAVISGGKEGSKPPVQEDKTRVVLKGSDGDRKIL